MNQNMFYTHIYYSNDKIKSFTFWYLADMVVL